VPRAPTPNFDRSKPFYPLVLHYVILLWAFTEIAGHGQRAREIAAAAGIDEGRSRARMGASQLPEPTLHLGSAITDDWLDVPFADISGETGANTLYLLEHTLPIAGGTLLIAAFETTKHHSDHGELWEFFRHCRNASAHGGRFRLYSGEPRRPAGWRGLEISRSLQGTSLLPRANEPGLLRPADPIRLLFDVEQTF
jgi:hypothetical protein